MRLVGQDFELSASDLVSYLHCRHLSALDRAVAEGTSTAHGKARLRLSIYPAV
jgi:hypothetical protein